MIIKYNPKLKELARQLRNNAIKAEFTLWQKLKRNQMNGLYFSVSSKRKYTSLNPSFFRREAISHLKRGARGVWINF
ncbi:DUF559 domain-containing protein [Flagellimonas halotolerans]|uniref:DUF559 domain-containing protein n=1 Tax=Flagellimonas halotolerans TaxID=3112164 RepID=A0ABU6IML0_9FLAO|nr:MULTISPECIES: DUF559 domain-containing protein [unclassified Allomuricauda]MEC3964478.1 DUF559 domain-containing protein [Muricauda sp. SYSU M86414]MEC4264347.1 DUF559 domain-containing protein [Muricauda sp. SYSU M84420]